MSDAIAAEIDELTRSLTAFDSFEAMLNSYPWYRPTIYPIDYKYVRLADAYDKAQEQRGDARRAYRGSNWPLPEPILSARLMGVPDGNPQHKDIEWLQVIWAINAASKARGEQWIGAPLYSHDWWAGGWCEEYRDFRVILKDELTNYVQARTPKAADALRAAFLQVTGRPLQEPLTAS